MEQKQRPPAKSAGRPRLTREQWLARRRRRRIRIIRNWILFLSACAVLVGLMTGVILWALPKISGMLGDRQEFIAPSYDLSGYVFDADDPYLVLVNNNLPQTDAETPVLEVADSTTGQQLEQEAAQAWKAMASAAQKVGIQLTLVEGYQTPERQQEAFDARKQIYLDQGMTEEKADSRAAAIVPRPGCNESGTGLAADILSSDYTTLDTGFADTDAFVTGMVYQPWHWRYVGVENARAIAASGLSLEEFVAVHQLS